MNTNQKIFAFCAISAIALVIVFPPFHITALGTEIKNGHHFILNPPNRFCKIDLVSVVVRCVVLLIAGTVGLLALADRRE